MEKKETSHRSIYAKGLFDGLNAAGMTIEEYKESKQTMMSHSRFQNTLNGMTSAARKVFDAVPISEPWSITQIDSELFRLGVKNDKRINMGCLDTLTTAGIIIEKPRGMFVRAKYKPEAAEKPALSAPQEITPPKKDAMTTTAQRPIEKLSALSQRVVVAMNALKDIAADIEIAAIEIDEQSRSTDEETKKLQQLKTLLKSLG